MRIVNVSFGKYRAKIAKWEEDVFWCLDLDCSVGNPHKKFKTEDNAIEYFKSEVQRDVQSAIDSIERYERKLKIGGKQNDEVGWNI
jgi:hypothetical protein